MKPYNRVAEKLLLNADHQGDWGYLHIILTLGIALDVTTGEANAVDALIADLQSRVGNTICVQTLAQKLNEIRSQV